MRRFGSDDLIGSALQVPPGGPKYVGALPLAQLQALGSATSPAVSVGDIAWDTTNGRKIRCKTTDTGSSTWVFTHHENWQRANTSNSNAERFIAWQSVTSQTSVSNANARRPCAHPGEIHSIRFKCAADPVDDITVKVYDDGVEVDSVVVADVGTDWATAVFSTAVWAADSIVAVSFTSESVDFAQIDVDVRVSMEVPAA